jgi:transcriptional regulator with XRE-family HTH domain
MKSGPEQLKDWMHRRRFMQREVAEHLGIHFTFVCQLIAGKRSPGLDNAIKIERLTGIPVEAWASSSIDESAEPIAQDAANAQHDKA